jgi:hypothetical protein
MLGPAMAAGYSTELWHDLFIGVAGAAAALTGLLFVSLSINLQQILQQVWLPRRAGLTVVLLFEALVIAILGLVPGQSSVALGVELLGLGGGAWLFATGVYTVRRPPVGSYRAPIVVGVVTSQLATLPVIVAGASLVSQRGGGLYWLVPGIVLLLGVGVINAWVLLIEILR